MNAPDRRDASRLRDMYENARLVLRFMQGKSRADLEPDSVLGYGVVRALEIIGEAANHVSEETRAQLTAVEWAAMIGMRNRVVHGYSDVKRQPAGPH